MISARGFNYSTSRSFQGLSVECPLETGNSVGPRIVHMDLWIWRRLSGGSWIRGGGIHWMWQPQSLPSRTTIRRSRRVRWRAWRRPGRRRPGNLMKLRSPWIVWRPLRRHPRNVSSQGCTATHPPWMCRPVGPLGQDPWGENKIIGDNNLCPFCLLHGADEICYSKIYWTKLACLVRSAKSFTTSGFTTWCKEETRTGSINVVRDCGGCRETIVSSYLSLVILCLIFCYRPAQYSLYPLHNILSNIFPIFGPIMPNMLALSDILGSSYNSSAPVS